MDDGNNFNAEVEFYVVLRFDGSQKGKCWEKQGMENCIKILFLTLLSFY